MDDVNSRIGQPSFGPEQIPSFEQKSKTSSDAISTDAKIQKIAKPLQQHEEALAVPLKGSGHHITDTPDDALTEKTEKVSHTISDNEDEVDEIPEDEEISISEDEEISISDNEDEVDEISEDEEISISEEEEMAPKQLFDWGLESQEITLAEIENASPEQLLAHAVQGAPISGEQLLDAAQKLAKTTPQTNETAILLHQLCDKAAEKFMLANDSSRAFQARAFAAAAISFPPTHPLHNMDAGIEARTVVQQNPTFGAHFSRLDTGVVKGGHLRAWRQNINGQEVNSFQLKLSPFARKDLQTTIETIQNRPDEFQSTLPEKLKGKEFSITETKHLYLGRTADGTFNNANSCNTMGTKALEIEFKGVGKVIIGNSPQTLCLYNEVRLELAAGKDEGESLKALHEILTVLGLGPVMSQSRAQDQERLKVAQLFHTYYPEAAYQLEHSKEFYEIPVEKLRALIEEVEPQMKVIFKKYLDDQLDLMQSIEIYPGREVFEISDLGDQMKAQGVYGLMSGIGQGGIESGVRAACRLLKGDGALSSQDRLYTGILGKGSSPDEDLDCGGGDQVFLRGIAKSIDNATIDQFLYHGSVQVLYDPSVVNRGAYWYMHDKYGSKREDVYGARKNIIDHARELSQRRLTQDDRYTGAYINNEVMVKNRIGPEYVVGLVVRSKDDKESLKTALMGTFLTDGKLNESLELVKRGLVEYKDNTLFIQGKPLDKFIHAPEDHAPEDHAPEDDVPDDNKFKREMWT